MRRLRRRPRSAERRPRSSHHNRRHTATGTGAGDAPPASFSALIIDGAGGGGKDGAGGSSKDGAGGVGKDGAGGSIGGAAVAVASAADRLLVFGEQLAGQPPPPAAAALDDSGESTEGEDDSPLGEYCE